MFVYLFIYYFIGKSFNSHQVKNSVVIVVAMVFLTGIQFQLTRHHQNKLIRKVGAENIMRVRFERVSKKYVKILQKQAELIFTHGIDVAGRHYEYDIYLSNIIVFNNK